MAPGRFRGGVSYRVAIFRQHHELDFASCRRGRIHRFVQDLQAQKESEGYQTRTNNLPSGPNQLNWVCVDLGG